ncbi:MAG: DUF5011 domain-containing protein [Bacteroidota bacterium]
MKTKKLFSGIIILALFFIISSCNTEDDSDITAPEISITGDNPVSIILGNAYTDAGATATDEVDGDLTSSITTTSNVNTAQKGIYSVTYSITDVAGNTSTATRTVNVVNSADFLAGGYSVTDVVTGNNAGTLNYNVNVSASDSINDILFIRNFGEFGSSVYIEITLSLTDSTLNIAAQSPSAMSNPGTITGTGFTNNSKITSVDYNCVYISGGSDHGSATYTKL